MSKVETNLTSEMLWILINFILCSQNAERLSLGNSEVSSLDHQDDCNPAQWFDYAI